MTKYIKRPIVIDAFQLGDISKPYPEWFNMQCLYNNEEGEQALINTLEGTMNAREGDYIIKGIKGEIYPCRPDIFEASYDVHRESN